MNGFLFEFGRRKNQPGRFLWLCAVDENRTSIRIENQLSLSPNHQQQNHNHNTQSKIHDFILFLFRLFRFALRRRQPQIRPRKNIFLKRILRNPLYITRSFNRFVPERKPPRPARPGGSERMPPCSASDTRHNREARSDNTC